MALSLDEFIAKYDGDYVDVDGMFSSQCKDLFSAYNSEVVGNPNYVWGNANQLWDNAPSEYYTKESIPQKGDAVIFSIPPYGHVAIYIEGNTSSFTSFDQNFPIGSPCHLQNHSYKNIIGYLRPKDNQETDMLNEQEVREGMKAFLRDLLGYEPTENDLNGHIGFLRDKQKDGNNYALSEWIHDRAKEVKAKQNEECKIEIAQAPASTLYSSITSPHTDCGKIENELKSCEDANLKLVSKNQDYMDEVNRLNIALDETKSKSCEQYGIKELIGLAFKKLFHIK